MPTTFRPYEPGRILLLAPDVRDWRPEGHFAHHVSDLVDGVDSRAFDAPYEGDGRRNAPHEPRMMVKAPRPRAAFPSGDYPARFIPVRASTMEGRRPSEDVEPKRSWRRERNGHGTTYVSPARRMGLRMEWIRHHDRYREAP